MAGESMAKSPKSWPAGKTYDLNGISVTCSAPVLVACRSDIMFWYPNLVRFKDGTLAANIRLGDDVVIGGDDSVIWWSHDGGLSWKTPQDIKGMQSYGSIPLPTGEVLMNPFFCYEDPANPTTLTAPCMTLDVKGKVKRRQWRISGLPSRVGRDTFNPQNDVAEAEKIGRVCFCPDGQFVRSADGKYLTTMYGVLGGLKRFTLLVAESDDAFDWRIRSVVADPDCGLGGEEGPCEADLCRTSDGRLMCVFRVGTPPFGQTFSSDEGRTWSKPVAMSVGTVEPRMLKTGNSAIALTCGRPGLYLAFNADGSGKEWQRVDTLAHHNAFVPAVQLNGSYPAAAQNAGGTSAYCGIMAVDDNSFLYIYDRVPESFRVRSGWKVKPQDAENPKEMFSIYIVKVTVEKR